MCGLLIALALFAGGAPLEVPTSAGRVEPDVVIGLTVCVEGGGAAAAEADAAARAVLCFSATSKNCNGHISVLPLVHEAATEECTASRWEGWDATKVG